jgi:hypothetical protein
MSREDLERLYSGLLEAVSSELKNAGYRRRGDALLVESEGNTGLIEFQRSVGSTPGALRFTVNLAVHIGTLEGGSQRRRTSTSAHLRRRLGHFMTPPTDKWWQIDSTTNERVLAAEILQPLLEIGVPFVERHLKTSAVVALWESGESPGLTAVQRERFLALLKERRAVDC